MNEKEQEDGQDKALGAVSSISIRVTLYRRRMCNSGGTIGLGQTTDHPDNGFRFPERLFDLSHVPDSE